ncbi:GNAT family N-acetyltransferase [Loigolactobacillus iwatensis]|uniref:GNAT family N-acetyltransferase n=1 Tax=Loigolactobacillus iwatensis TaxID=1267156 RepID=UPI000F7DDBF6|nr:GNAT family N-acetyltransferase [Loigolactobacillus iwatensis]
MKIQHTTDTTSRLYQDALSIRKRVFVHEQNVSLALEIDENETKTIHFVGYVNDQPVTTARLLPEKKAFHVQRVATLKIARGHHYGQQLFTALENYAVAHNKPALILGGQDQALGFYEKLGFHKTERPGFLDAGIPHHEMYKQL